MPFPNSRNSYAGLESTKRAGQIAGPNLDAQLAQQLRGASVAFETDTRRAYIPYTQTKAWRWPQDFPGWTWRLWVEEDLIAATEVLTRAGSDTPVAITHYFLEPQQLGPPYNRIEVDLASQDVFQSGNTPQRSAVVTGRWGYYERLGAAGSLVSGLAADPAATTCVVSNSAPCETLTMLLADDEQMQIEARANIDTTATITADVDAKAQTVTIPLSNGALVFQGEIIAIDSEQMFVSFIVGNNATVERAYNGTVLAAHVMNAHVYAPRGLILSRGANGTTPAVHADAIALQKYEAPDDVAILIQGECLAKFEQALAHWGRTVGMGGGEVNVEASGRALAQLRKNMVDKYKRQRGDEAV